MNKALKKFILFAMIAVFVLLTALLAVINAINFTMASDDADKVIEMLKNERGRFAPGETVPADDLQFSDRRGIGPMGPSSPETRNSTMYFTFKFDDGNAESVGMRISAMTVDEAMALAESIYKSGKTSGWVKMTYRFGVYQSGKSTFVTVIDQGRELLPSYRILIFSVIGETVGLIISFLFLSFIGKKLFAPLEEADRKQKNFISDAEAEFKVPLTVISANAELIEKENGRSEYTSSIQRQVRKMTSLVKDLGALAIFNEEDAESVSFSEILRSVTDGYKDSIKANIDIDDGITVKANKEMLYRMVSEIADNAKKYSEGDVSFSLKSENGRIIFRQTNKTSLPDGNVEQVFDRFTTLQNAAESSHGIGLSFVKDAVRQMGGRCGAKVENGVFVLEITL